MLPSRHVLLAHMRQLYLILKNTKSWPNMFTPQDNPCSKLWVIKQPRASIINIKSRWKCVFGSIRSFKKRKTKCLCRWLTTADGFQSSRDKWWLDPTLTLEKDRVCAPGRITSPELEMWIFAQLINNAHENGSVALLGLAMIRYEATECRVTFTDGYK